MVLIKHLKECLPSLEKKVIDTLLQSLDLLELQ
jgi:hypothetical protein